MIEIVVTYRARSIGSMEVKRVLPFSKRRSVGPFVFVDEMGPIAVSYTHLDVYKRQLLDINSMSGIN